MDARNYVPMEVIAVRKLILVDPTQNGQVGDVVLTAANNALASRRSGGSNSGIVLTPVYHLQVTPRAVANNAIHAAIVLGVGSVVTTGITNPVVPCVPSITGVGAGATGNVVLAGTNINDLAITDTIALAGATTVSGAKVFKTITSITVPADSGATGETVAIGITKKIGLRHALTLPVLVSALFNGAADAGTLSVDATDISKNLFTVAGTPDNAKPLDVFYLVN